MVGGAVDAARWCADERLDADFDVVGTADLEEAFAAWEEECKQGRQVPAAMGLDNTSAPAASRSASAASPCTSSRSRAATTTTQI